MSVEAQTFTNKSNGETFTKGSYNGIEVLRRDKDGYINATKMCCLLYTSDAADDVIDV